MQRRARKKKVDLNELAATVVDQATDEKPPEETPPDDTPTIDPTKNPHAVALSKLGSKKGGLARWKGVSKKKRSEAARKAALVRWKKKK